MVKDRDYGRTCVDGDIVEMILNLYDLTLSYKINNKDYSKAFDVEKTSYRAAISSYYKNDKFTLLSYNCR